MMEEKPKRLRRSKLAAFKEIWRRFKKNKPAMVGFCVFCFIIFFIIFAPLFANYEEMAIAMGNAPGMLTPSLKGLFTAGETPHLLGTDVFGRDVFARIIHGGRNTIFIGLFSTLISVTFGGILGATAAYYGKGVDNAIMRTLDVVSCIPSLLLSLAIIAALGPNLVNLLIGLTIGSLAGYSRLIRSVVMTITGQDFIEAAKACGTNTPRMLSKHIIPNAMGPIIIQAATSVSGMILMASGLSYLGLGIQPPAPEWGAMLSEAKQYMHTNPHLIIVPGVTIVITALSITLIGDGLRDALDPKLKD